MKRYTSVPMNWTGKIDSTAITSALLTKDITTVQHYQNYIANKGFNRQNIKYASVKKNSKPTKEATTTADCVWKKNDASQIILKINCWTKKKWINIKVSTGVIYHQILTNAIICSFEF